ncbi:MAG: hypothetical protein JSW64_10590 [Candidatus Zixiibacteriota bacterium]|nr:MAG: hypothetical protein JSW64_10590 [candidate division Zixibacteria bacterium]
MFKKLREQQFRFSKDGEDVLTLSYKGARNWDVLYKGDVIGSFKFNRKELKRGREFKLPDGSDLLLRYVKRGSLLFWEASLNGKTAYNTLVSQHRYIWGSWLAVAFIFPLSLIVQYADVPGADEVVIPIIIIEVPLILAVAFLVKIRWKPVAWIMAVLWVVGLGAEWLSFISDPQGIPPILETIGVLIFRDFLVNAKFVWRVLDQLTSYMQA